MQLVYNLKIDSPYLIPGFQEIYDNKPDINIYSGFVPQTIANALAKTPFYQISMTEFLLTVPNIAKYYVCNSSEIRIERAPKATEDDITLFLMDSPFTILLQLRGLISLRGTAITKNGKAIVFSGRTKLVKSALADALIRNGYKLVSDGNIVTDGKQIFPGRSYISLWKDMALKAGYDLQKLIPVRQSLERYWIDCQDSFQNAPIPLKKIYLFCDSKTDSLKTFMLTGETKMTALFENTSWFYLPVLSVLKKKFLPIYTALAQNTKMIKINFHHENNSTIDESNLFKLIKFLECDI
jgi:hypothetical protein